MTLGVNSFRLAVTAAVAMYAVGAGAGNRPCKDQVRELAERLADWPSMMALKTELAKASVLCSDGDEAAADKLLADVKRQVEIREADPVGSGQDQDRQIGK